MCYHLCVDICKNQGESLIGKNWGSHRRRIANKSPRQACRVILEPLIISCKVECIEKLLALLTKRGVLLFHEAILVGLHDCFAYLFASVVWDRRLRKNRPNEASVGRHNFLSFLNFL